MLALLCALIEKLGETGALREFAAFTVTTLCHSDMGDFKVNAVADLSRHAKSVAERNSTGLRLDTVES